MAYFSLTLLTVSCIECIECIDSIDSIGAEENKKLPPFGFLIRNPDFAYRRRIVGPAPARRRGGGSVA